MDPRSEGILTSADLPTLQVRALPTGRGLDHLPDLIYVRAPSPAPSPGVVRRADVPLLLARKDARDLRYVDVIDSWGGAVYLRQGNHALVELTLGHLSGLLRHGLLSARFLFEGGRLVGELRYHQARFADVRGNLDAPKIAVSDVTLRDAAQDLHARVGASSVAPNVLQEIMLSAAGPIWVDAKTYPSRLRMPAAISLDRRLVYGDGRAKDVLPMSCELTEMPSSLEGYAVTINENALLCHLVTYALDRGLADIWNHDETGAR